MTIYVKHVRIMNKQNICIINSFIKERNAIMYKTLLEQYEGAFGIESKQKVRRKCISRRIKLYKTYKGIFGERRAQELIRDSISQNKL